MMERVMTMWRKCYAVQVNCRGYEKGLASAFDLTTDEGSRSIIFEGLGGENMTM